MININDIHPDDQRFIIKDPVNFSAERNRAIIDETIRETERKHRKMHEAIDAGLQERIEAVSYYGAYRFNKGSKSIKEYLGPKKWQEMVGEHLLEKIRVMKASNKLAGNDKFENSILL